MATTQAGGAAQPEKLSPRDILRLMAGSTKATRNIPTGNDFKYHSHTGQFGAKMTALQARVEPLILGLLQQVSAHMTHCVVPRVRLLWQDSVRNEMSQRRVLL